VQQFVPCVQAESSDNAIDGLSHGISAFPQRSVVLSGGDRQFFAARIEDMKLQEFVADHRKSRITVDALKHFAQNQIRESKALRRHFVIQPGGLRVLDASQVIDQYGRVDNYHDELTADAVQTGLVEIALPLHFSAKLSERPLSMGSGKQSQSGVYRGFLGTRTTAPHGATHQLVINLNIGAHNIYV
jgi:hypothetical protein